MFAFTALTLALLASFASRSCLLHCIIVCLLVNARHVSQRFVFRFRDSLVESPEAASLEAFLTEELAGPQKQSKTL